MDQRWILIGQDGAPLKLKVHPADRQRGKNFRREKYTQSGHVANGNTVKHSVRGSAHRLQRLRPHGSSDDAVVQQRLRVLGSGGGRGLFVAARQRRVDVDAGQRGQRLLAVWEGLVAEGELRGRGGGRGAAGFLGDEEGNEEGDDHGAGAQQEGRPRDERLLQHRTNQAGAQPEEHGPFLDPQRIYCGPQLQFRKI